MLIWKDLLMESKTEKGERERQRDRGKETEIGRQSQRDRDRDKEAETERLHPAIFEASTIPFDYS